MSIGAIMIHHLPRLSLSERSMLLELIGHDYPSLNPSAVAELTGRPCRAGWDVNQACDEAAREFDWLCTHEGGLVTITEQRYPRLLREIYDPPFALYFRGKSPVSRAPFVALVGTRHPNGRGAHSAFSLGEGLGRLSIPVVSGLAMGIDRQAHLGNAAAGAPSVAVLGSGLNEVSPVSSRPAAEKLLAAGGVLVSEYPVFLPARPYHFPMRNRIISGMSLGTVVIQAPAKSGALITADYALEQGREVLVHGDCLQSGVGEGGRRLIEDGAVAVRSAEEVLRELPIPEPVLSNGERR